MVKKLLVTTLLSVSCINAFEFNDIKENINNNKNSINNSFFLIGNNNDTKKYAYEYCENGWNVIENDISKIFDAQRKEGFKLISLKINEKKSKNETKQISILINIVNVAKKIVIKEATNKITNVILSNDNAITNLVNYCTTTVDLLTGTKYTKLINGAKKTGIFNYLVKTKAKKELKKCINNILTISVDYALKKIVK